MGIPNRYNISLPSGFAEWIDSWAEETGMARSEFIREAVKFYVADLKKKEVNHLKMPLPNEN